MQNKARIDANWLKAGVAGLRGPSPDFHRDELGREIGLGEAASQCHRRVKGRIMPSPRSPDSIGMRRRPATNAPGDSSYTLYSSRISAKNSLVCTVPSARVLETFIIW